MPNLVKKYCKVCDKITPHYPGGDPLEMHCTRSHVAILKESTPSDFKKFSMMQEEPRSVASDRTELSSTDHIADVGKMVGKTDPSTEQESQEGTLERCGPKLYKMERSRNKIIRPTERLQNKPQVECPSCKKHFDGEDEMEFHFWRFHISPGFKESIRRVFRGH